MDPAHATAAQKLDAAREAYQAGRLADAARLLNGLLRAEPKAAPAHALMGLCLIAAGDPGQAEKAFRAALDLDRTNADAALGLAGVLMRLNRDDEAQALIAPLVARADAPAAALDIQSELLRRANRLDEALATSARAEAAGSPKAGVDRAILLRELGRYVEAEAAARAAVDRRGGRDVRGQNALGFILVDQHRLEDAEAVFREALTKAPLDLTLHMGLARLLWSRTGDPDRAAEALDAALRQRATPQLLALRARLHTRAGQLQQAYGLLAEASKHIQDDALLHGAAATAAIHAGETEAGVAHAERAVALTGETQPRLRHLLAETYIAAGRPEQASEVVEALRRLDPLEQHYIAVQALAWRILGDERYHDVYDFERMVRAFSVPAPKGWSSLDAFLSDLAEALKPMQVMRADPLDQSLRKGIQTEQNLALREDPVFRGFFAAIEAPIDEYIAGLGRGADPLRSRIAADRKIRGAWSVKLEPGGFHVNHLHPEGWLSSAFYVQLPKTVDEGREGWLKFGEPGIPTRPGLEPDHHVKPEPGRLVLFPSYMWHGTVPFGGEAPRLTMAFDVVPTK